MSVRRWLTPLTVAAAALAASALALPTPALASTALASTPLVSTALTATPQGTKIVLADTAFGWSLAVGSEPFKGYTLYYISSDHGTSFGCTAGPTSTPIGPLTCTGPSNDKNAEWPAITTTGKPVAGPGVHQSLLGRLYRKGVGWQVTYAGHPLYLFDQQAGAVTGEGWFEPGLPPWHGVWWLISAGGEPVPWAGTLTTTNVDGKTVLAEPFMTGIGWVNFPVYTFSGDAPYYRAACSASATCARAWPPLLTSGVPGHSGVSGYGIGEIRIPGWLSQVTWYGHPLYLFSHEALAPTASGGAAPAGNGNGVTAFGGTFRLVVNP
ncbi:MAG: hypothetical protein ACHP9Z_26140 [Streptosporangiales bacterium]